MPPPSTPLEPTFQPNTVSAGAGAVVPAPLTWRTLDDLFEADAGRTLRDLLEMEAELSRQGVHFAGRTHSTFIKPDMVSHADMAQLQRIIPPMMRAIERVIAQWPQRPDLDRFLGINDEWRPFIEIDPRVRSRAVVVARLDGFLRPDDGLQFVEFNVDSPAGAGFADVVEETILNTATFREFLGLGVRVRRVNRRRRLLHALIEYYREWRACCADPALHPAQPTIAIADWAGVSTASEFELLAAYFEAHHHVKCLVVDPREFTLSRRFGGALLEARGQRIDLVYRRALVHELAARRPDVQPLEHAARMGVVCVANPFRAKAASSKNLLELLTDPDFDFMFDAEENRIRHTVLPWTRRLRHSFVSFAGKTVDLVRLVRDRREDFVIKPASGCSGQGVMIGRETEPGTWDAALHLALRSGEWVVQKFVPIPETPMPVRIGASSTGPADESDSGSSSSSSGGRGFRLESKKINLAPFVFGGRFGGAMARLSDRSVINVSRGGGMVPTLAVALPPESTE